jgi:hypothetical protein
MTPSLQSKAGIIGIRSSLIGSFLFSIIEKIDFTLNPSSTGNGSIDYGYLLRWLIADFIIGFILSVYPGYLGGRLLSNLKMRFSSNQLMIFGAGMGIVSIILISLPYLFVVLSAHNWWSFNNNSLVPVYVHRLVEASIIAALMGSWSGFLISKSRLSSIQKEPL